MTMMMFHHSHFRFFLKNIFNSKATILYSSDLKNYMPYHK